MLFFLNRNNIKMYIHTHTHTHTHTDSQCYFLVNHIYSNTFTKLSWHLFAFHWLLRSRRCFLYHFPYRYTWKLITLSFLSIVFSSTILFGEREFTRSARTYLSNCKKEDKKKRETWKWNWWEVFPTGKFFRHCSCGNWRYRDAVANFVLPHLADR